MTNHNDDTQIDAPQEDSRQARRKFLTGAGIAGAVAVVGTSSTASAANGDNVIAGQDVASTSTTSVTNDGTSADRSNNAVKGVISNADNNSHAVLGTTVGDGHAVAGVVGTPTGPQPANPVAATWGRSYAASAATEGQSLAEDIPLAGSANGVKGIVESESNGAHAVLGITAGAGHSVAGDTPADAAGPDGEGSNTTAATWGRHGGAGAGIGGVSADGYGGEFIGGKSHVRLIQSEDSSNAGPPSGGAHLLGELYADGAGELWYNTSDGSNWVSLTRPSTGGTVLMTDAQRAFDSRAGRNPASTKGRIGAGETIEIDLTEFTDFPAGSQGALINVTIVDPSPGAKGFATVFNGTTADDERPDTSTINWGTTTEVIANTTTAKVSSSGSIKVYVRRETDLIIDVIGYVG